MVINCQVCNKPFDIPLYRKDTAKFCSHRCRGISLKGKHLSPATEFEKGHPAPPTAFRRGNPAPATAFKKGLIPWNKGIIWEDMRGENHPNWRGGKPKIYRKELLSFEDYRKYTDFQKAVFRRDGWNCQSCGSHGGLLHAHHIKSWARHPELRYDTDNGITLCPPCHRKTDSYSIKAASSN